MGARLKTHQNVSGYKPVLQSLELLESGIEIDHRNSQWIYVPHYYYSESIGCIKLLSLFLKQMSMRQYQFELHIVVIFRKSLTFYR